MAYGCGALIRHGADRFDRVVLSIDQPALGPVRTAEISISRLREFAATLTALGERIARGDAPRVPGAKQCKWCSFADRCPERAAWVLDEGGLVALPDTGELPLADALTPTQVGRILRAKKEVEAWLDALYVRALRDAEVGVPTPGLKLVAGRAGNRTWCDESQVAALGDIAFERVLMSPAKLEKALGKGSAIPATVQAEGRPQLVPIEDKRPAMTLVDALDILD